MECPNIKGCTLYSQFKTQALKNIYIKIYCLGKFESCKRKQLKDSGMQVPVTLLPDGKDLESL